jgi:putative ABC transport system permease protein
MDLLRQDLSFAIRTMRRHATFAVTAVSLVALAVGAATTAFGVVNAVLLRPLPYDDPEHLVALTSVFRSSEENRISRTVRLVDIEAWRETSRMVASAGAFAFTRLPVQVGDRAFIPTTAITDPGVLPTLGNALGSGSYFAADSAGEADATVIISDAFRRQAFGDETDVVGRAITVNGSTRTVRGVLARDFLFLRPDARVFREAVQLLIPAPGGFSPEVSPWRGVARLAPGVSIGELDAELTAASAGIAERSPDREGWSLVAAPLDAETTANVRQPLLIILGIFAALLLIAGTNLTNLLLSRGTARAHEMAIRAAMGGTTARLMRHQLVESLCLTLAGGALGLALAAAAIRLLSATLPAFLPLSGPIEVDLTVLAFAVGTCTGLGVIAGLASALAGRRQASRFGRSFSSGVSSRALPRAQQSLCVAQVALCVVPLAAAGVLVHSLWRLNTIDTGLDTEGILAFQATWPPSTGFARQQFVTRALAQIEAIPGVVQAEYATYLPPESRLFSPISIDAEAPPGSTSQLANVLMTSEGYFATLGLTVLRGRSFEATDNVEVGPVAIVSESFVRTYLDVGTEPLGAGVSVPLFNSSLVREIVGVVSDARNRSRRLDPIPVIYLPYRQTNMPYGSFAVRAAVAPKTLIPIIRSRLNALDPSVPLEDFQMLDNRMYDSLESPRFNAYVAAGCALLAVLFVAVGLYGVIAYAVSRRTLEFGIRSAIGARSGNIIRLVLGQSVRLSLMGSALGIGLAMLLTQPLGALLFQVKPIDPVTLSGSFVLVMAVAVLASLMPAVRACRVSPATALRYD